jgi:hypothetical protein
MVVIPEFSKQAKKAKSANLVLGISEIGDELPKNLKQHPLCKIFPPLSEDEIKALGADIKANGQIAPILLYEGKILDGWQCEMGAVAQAVRLASCSTLSPMRARREHRMRPSWFPRRRCRRADLTGRHALGALRVGVGKDEAVQWVSVAMFGKAAEAVPDSRRVTRSISKAASSSILGAAMTASIATDRALLTSRPSKHTESGEVGRNATSLNIEPRQAGAATRSNGQSVPPGRDRL